MTTPCPFILNVAIKSPFKHFIPLSSANQPTKPILPVDSDNTYAADQDIALQVEDDAAIYLTDQVDQPKSATSAAQASALATLSTSDDAVSAIKSALVLDAPFYETSKQIDYVFSKVAPHPGYGSCSARILGEVYQGKSVAASATGLVDFRNTVTAPVSASVTTYSSRTEVTASCDMEVASATYQVISYRWRDQNAADQPWGISCSGNPFTFHVDSYYNLAVRVRISPMATLLGGDWTLQYTSDPDSPSTWRELLGPTPPITIAYGPHDPPDDMVPWPISASVTPPGPGNPVQVDGAYAYPDNQSVRVSLGVPYITEVETIFRLYLAPDLPNTPVYFRIASQVEGITVVPSSGLLAQPWMTEITS